jgi:FkbM family methyltransferase
MEWGMEDRPKVSTIAGRPFSKNTIYNIIDEHEHSRIQNMGRFQTGAAHIFDKALLFPDSFGFLYSLAEIFVDEPYRFLASNVSPLIIDVGSNIGLSIIYFKRLYPISKIIAFEPDPALFELLERNITTMGYQDVELRNSAAWIEDTTLPFFSEGSLGGSSIVNHLRKANPLTVKAERLRSLLADKHVDFLKLDIEGAENEVLFDLDGDLGKVENMFVEYHSPVNKPQVLGDILSVITSAGFRYHIKAIGDSTVDLLPFPFVDRVSSGFDLQLDIFCYRNSAMTDAAECVLNSV